MTRKSSAASSECRAINWPGSNSRAWWFEIREIRARPNVPKLRCCWRVCYGRFTFKRRAGSGFHLGVGGTVLHSDPRAPRRRSHPDREHAAAVCHAADSAVRRQPARTQPRRLLQPVQPGQAQHPAGSAEARSGQARLPTGQALRRRGRQFRRRRDRQARLQLREAARDQTRHHPDLDVRLRAAWSVQTLRRLWAAGLRALGAVLADRLSGRRSRRRSASRIPIPTPA